MRVLSAPASIIELAGNPCANRFITFLPVAFFSTACAPLSPAFAQGPQTRAEENCSEITRNFELIKAQAVSIQTNMALFAAADRGCDDLARKLLDSGASLLARDRRGAMPLAHAARSGQIKLVEFFVARGAPIDARNVDGGTALYDAAQSEKHSTVALLTRQRRRSKYSRQKRRDAADRRSFQRQRPHP